MNEDKIFVKGTFKSDDKWVTKIGKILYFEDDASIAAMYQMKIEQEGFEVKHYLNPPKKNEDLVKLVLEENPDLIIMDIIMPEIDGYSATKILKSNTETKDFPVMGISNMGQKEAVDDAVNCGMVDYFISSRLMPSEFADCIKKFFDDQSAYTPQYKKYL